MKMISDSNGIMYLYIEGRVEMSSSLIFSCLTYIHYWLMKPYDISPQVEPKRRKR